MPFFGKAKPFHIQPLVRDFAEDCAALHAAAFPHSWAAPEFEHLIGAETTLGDAAVESRVRRLFGFALSRRALDEAEILTVTVDATLRGQGIAGRILDVHLPRLGRHGATTVFLEVAETNVPALRLYARFGFDTVGRRQGYYRAADGRTVTALTMRRRLS